MSDVVRIFYIALAVTFLSALAAAAIEIYGISKVIENSSTASVLVWVSVLRLIVLVWGCFVGFLFLTPTCDNVQYFQGYCG